MGTAHPLGDFHDSPITSGMGTMAYLSGQISKSTAGVASGKIHAMSVLPEILADRRMLDWATEWLKLSDLL
ncbi:hypothetical protein PABG_03988 [Paracoccidioides brasiliensis Pb03]|nr:hypothetical protein PABG_03988 [Paracoccidioides brasiliensis Pb03]